MAGVERDRYRVTLDVRSDDIAGRWDAQMSSAAATAFQSGRWLDAWYATIGRAVGEPIRLMVHDCSSGDLAVMLPLVRRNIGGVRVIEFADDAVSDNNAPVLGPASPTEAEGARRLWSATRAALPAADLAQFAKMPAEVEGRANPLVLLPWAQSSPFGRNIIPIDASFEDYLRSLKSMYRQQLARAWRVFSGHDGATFRQISDPAEAANVFAALERQQSDRLRTRGRVHALDRPETSIFYRQFIALGIGTGEAVLTTLMRHDEVVAAVLGVTRGTTWWMVRISIGAPHWSNCSPGRLVIARTMQMLHERGFRRFDLSIGDDDYKHRLGAQRVPLFDLTVALSARGLPALAFDRAKRLVRRHPRALAFARTIAAATRSASRDPA